MWSRSSRRERDSSLCFSAAEGWLREGLFDPVETSLAGFSPSSGSGHFLARAALRDIVTVAAAAIPRSILSSLRPSSRKRRPASIIKALNYAIATAILISSSGQRWGSLRTSSFNDEESGRLFLLHSRDLGGGPETDVTITDLVADHRAPTPSAAAEMAVPDVSAIAAQLISLYERLRRMAQRRVDQGRRQVSSLAERSVLQRPEERLNRLRLTLDERERSLLLAVRNGYRLNKDRLIGLAGRLELLSP